MNKTSPTDTTDDQARKESATADKQIEQHDEEKQQDGAEKADSSKSCRGKVRWIILAVVVLIAVAIIGGVLGTQSSPIASPTATPTPAPTASFQPSMPPTQVPSQSPTTVRFKVEAILEPYAPLDEEVMEWLTEISSWQPEPDDPDYDYLWLERYALASLYKTTDGPIWENNVLWMTDYATCEWYGSKGCPGPITDLSLRK